MARLEENHPNAIGITHHAGFGVDAMTSPTNSAFAAAFSPFHFPSMTIDRIKFDSVPSYYTKYVGVSMMAFKWEDTVLAILTNTSAKAEVKIVRNWDAGTRKISGNVDVKFLTAVPPGDLRINLYIVEDSVIGDTGHYDYDQKNNRTNDNNYPELYGKTVIQYYPHRNVVRNAPLGDWGKSGIIPTTPVAGIKYSTPFTYTLPEKYDLAKGRTVYPEKIKLVAFVSYYDANTWHRQVINAEEVGLMTTSAVKEKENLSEKTTLFPNPADEVSNLSFSVPSATNIKVELLDLSGKTLKILHQSTIKEGNYTLNVNCASINNGNYLIKLSTSEFTIVKRLTIIH
jgi:hypothetical protein